MRKFPVLNSERLDFIEIKEEHLDDLFRLFSDPEVVKFYNLLPFENPIEGMEFINWYKSRYNEGLAIRWGIALKGEQNIIGTIGFNNYSINHRANIGYDLQKSHWNKGYITESLETIVKFGFEQLRVNRIEAEVMHGNYASEKVLEKLGFTKEGILRQWMFWNNKHFDMTMYSLLKGDDFGD